VTGDEAGKAGDVTGDEAGKAAGGLEGGPAGRAVLGPVEAASVSPADGNCSGECRCESTVNITVMVREHGEAGLNRARSERIWA
jgi:hypothetical protein